MFDYFLLWLCIQVHFSKLEKTSDNDFNSTEKSRQRSRKEICRKTRSREGTRVPDGGFTNSQKIFDPADLFFAGMTDSPRFWAAGMTGKTVKIELKNRAKNPRALFDKAFPRA